MTRPGSFLKNIFNHRPRVSKSASTAKQTESESSSFASPVYPLHVATESSFNGVCGSAQHGPPSLACASSCTVMTCYSVSMAEKPHVFAKAVDDPDLCPAVVQADVFGSPAQAGDPNLDMFRCTYVQGVSQAAIYSSLVLSRDQNILNEHGRAEHIFSDAPSELAWQLRSGLDGFYEFSEVGEVSASRLIKSSCHACNNSAVDHGCIVEDARTAELQKEVQPVLDVSTFGRTGNFPENGNNTVVLAAAQSAWLPPSVRPHVLDDEVREVKGSPFSTISNKPSNQAPSPRLESALVPGLQVAHVHCAVEGVTTSGVRKEVVLQDGNTGLKEEHSTTTRARQMASEICKRLRVICGGCFGGTRSTITLVGSCATVVLLVAVFLWLTYSVVEA